MKPNISVQMIAKENTVFGEKVFRACLNSLFEADYVSQLVIVDNGCSDPVQSMMKDVVAKFINKDVQAEIVPFVGGDFSKLRNVALERTAPETDYIHWVDTDEVYYPDKLTAFGAQLGASGESVVVLNLVHFMIVPNHYQEIYPKDVVYRYNVNMTWGNGVHEKVQGASRGPTAHYDMPYLHFGYCRRQWRTALKWFHYDVIERGSANHYKMENVNGVVIPYFRGERTPDNIVGDRLLVSSKFKDIYPQVVIDEGFPLDADEATWKEYLSRIDDETFWIEWQDMYNKCGAWEDTLDTVVSKAKEDDWRMV